MRGVRRKQIESVFFYRAQKSVFPLRRVVGARIAFDNKHFSAPAELFAERVSCEFRAVCVIGTDEQKVFGQSRFFKRADVELYIDVYDSDSRVNRFFYGCDESRAVCRSDN